MDQLRSEASETRRPRFGLTRRRGALLGAAATVVTAFAAIGIGAATSASADSYESLDLNAHCKRHHGDSAYARLLEVEGVNYVWDWRCFTVSGSEANRGPKYDIDMNAACREQYGDRAGAGYNSQYNPFSWYCHIL